MWSIFKKLNCCSPQEKPSEQDLNFTQSQMKQQAAKTSSLNLQAKESVKSKQNNLQAGKIMVLNK